MLHRRIPGAMLWMSATMILLLILPAVGASVWIVRVVSVLGLIIALHTLYVMRGGMVDGNTK